MRAERERYGEPGSVCREWFDDNKWYPREFNDVVGWIEVYALGNQVRGIVWWVTAKSIRRTMRHRHFVREGDLFEISFCPDETVEEIRERVEEELRRILRLPRYRKRYIDINSFLELSRFIRWRELLQRTVSL